MAANIDKKKRSSWTQNLFIGALSIIVILLIASISTKIIKKFEVNDFEKTSTQSVPKLSLFFDPLLFSNGGVGVPNKENVKSQLSGVSYNLNVNQYSLPANSTEYFNNMNFLNKIYDDALVVPSVDVGVLPTFEFIKLLKFNKKIIPHYTFSKKIHNDHFGMHIAQVLVRSDSDIKEFSDLKNKRVTTFLPENPLFFPVKMLLLESSSLNLKLIVTRDLNRSYELLKEKSVDAIIVSGYEFENSKDVLTNFPMSPENHSPLKEIYRYQTHIPSQIIYAEENLSKPVLDEFFLKFEQAVELKKIEQTNIVSLKKIEPIEANKIIKTLSNLNGSILKFEELVDPTKNTDEPNQYIPSDSPNILNRDKIIDSLGINDKKVFIMFFQSRGYTQNSIDEMLSGDIEHLKDLMKKTYRNESAQRFIPWLMD